MHQENPGGLDKFEQLIFSGLVASEESIPSTFDGIEQLVKALKGFKPS